MYISLFLNIAFDVVTKVASAPILSTNILSNLFPDLPKSKLLAVG